MNTKNDNSIMNFGIIFIVVCICFYILYIGASFIIPFIISVLLAFAILAVFGFYKKKFKMNSFFAMVFSFLTYLLAFFVIGNIISSNINDIIELAPSYQDKINSIFSDILTFFKIKNPEKFIKNLFGDVNLQSILLQISGSVKSILSDAGIIFFYTMFILIESKDFNLKWLMIFPDKTKREGIFETIDKIKLDIKSYFLIKVMVSFIVGIASYFIMLAFGLNLALFWGLLIFLLNFIPFIGSIIGVAFPSILGFIQPDFTPYMAFVMISLLISAQAFVGNVIEPKLMGNRLNLSPLVIILSLSFWGIIRGFWGMVLSVPIMVTINIILSRIEQTRPIAILLSEKGDLQMDSMNKKGGKIKKKFLKKFLKGK